MRLPRFRVRTLMVTVAFVALVLTVIMQAIWLRRAAATQQMLRAEAQLRLAVIQAELVHARADAEVERAFAKTSQSRSAQDADRALDRVQQGLRDR